MTGALPLAEFGLDGPPGVGSALGLPARTGPGAASPPALVGGPGDPDVVRLFNNGALELGKGYICKNQECRLHPSSGMLRMPGSATHSARLDLVQPNKITPAAACPALERGPQAGKA